MAQCCMLKITVVINVYYVFNKYLSYRRKTALQGRLVLAESGRLGLGDDILQTL